MSIAVSLFLPPLVLAEVFFHFCPTLALIRQEDGQPQGLSQADLSNKLLSPGLAELKSLWHGFLFKSSFSI